VEFLEMHEPLTGC